MKNLLYIVLLLVVATGCRSRSSTGKEDVNNLPPHVFSYSDNLDPRWVSFENRDGTKGGGGMENAGAKGHACDSIRAGGVKTLLNIKGPGIINRIWVTINDRTPEMLRSLVLNMYWDNSEKPAVSVPFGDFFGVGLGRTAVFENDLFANPEGRSFNSFIQMPFKTAARIELVNESGTDLPMVFYDVDLQLMKKWQDDFLYFHCFWHRDTLTTLGKDFEIMPKVTGKGRFLGTNVSIQANPVYKDCWWGEGEVKIYLNGDGEYPTLIGTGTEDYIGTAWGQGQFHTRFTGCLIADPGNLLWTFYRYHIPDPVYFRTDCRVTIQQMGGNSRDIVIAMQKQKVSLVPVTIHKAPEMIHIYKKENAADLVASASPEAWINFYRSDDVAATAYFYLDRPVNELPGIQPVALRTSKLKQ